MNIYRIAGDSCHVLAVFILFVQIWKAKSVEGISGRSQILFALTYIFRYVDVFLVYISFYNTVMKIFFVLITLSTIYLIFHHFKKTYNRELDTFRIEFLIIPALTLAFFVNYDFTTIEILWAFSIFLEAVAILPQLYLVSKIGEVENVIIMYLIALGSYRGFYLANWIYRYYFEGHYDAIAVFSGIVQTIPYFFFCFFVAKREKQISYVLTV